MFKIQPKPMAVLSRRALITDGWWKQDEMPINYFDNLCFVILFAQGLHQSVIYALKL
jgi:hypothetical protein